MVNNPWKSGFLHIQGQLQYIHKNTKIFENITYKDTIALILIFRYDIKRRHYLINSVSVHNFKVLEKLENVPLSKITLIGGKNNTGKTTFLETLILYLGFHIPDVIGRLFSWRDFHGNWVRKQIWNKFFKIYRLTEQNIG